MKSAVGTCSLREDGESVLHALTEKGIHCMGAFFLVTEVPISHVLWYLLNHNLFAIHDDNTFVCFVYLLTAKVVTP